MIIDVHVHYTTAPAALNAYRGAQITLLNDPRKGSVKISDDEIRDTLENGQLKMQRERGTDLVLFSPTAAAMGHHFGNALISQYWSETTNELIHRVCGLYPDNFVGVCMLPQSPGVPPANCIGELERCVTQFGFVACNLNPDPSGGYWTDPPLTDEQWYPLYEKMVELDVPAMIHVAAACNPNFHTTGSHYINGDPTAFMQLLTGSKLFERFPTLKFVLPHGGGAIPYHWGRYRGIAQDRGDAPPEQLLNNIFFDTCVYHQRGVELLIDVIGVDSVAFASEMIGAVRSKDVNTGYYYDDTKRYVDAMSLTDEQRHKLFEGTARKVYPRLDALLKQRGK